MTTRPPISATMPCASCDAPISVVAEVCPACGVRQYDPGHRSLGAGSDKRTGLAAVLAFFFGVFGAHRFYLGRPKTAVLQLLTLGGLGIWMLVDFIMILFGELRDGEGRKLQGLF